MNLNIDNGVNEPPTTGCTSEGTQKQLSRRRNLDREPIVILFVGQGKVFSFVVLNLYCHSRLRVITTRWKAFFGI